MNLQDGTLHSDIREILKDRSLKLNDKVERLAELLEAGNYLLTTLDVNDARIPVETVEVYGLKIALDANGRASIVACDAGFFSDDTTREI